MSGRDNLNFADLTNYGRSLNWLGDFKKFSADIAHLNNRSPTSYERLPTSY